VKNKRIWEIDLFRAVAITLMVIFHFVFDLNRFAGLDIEYLSGFWFWVGRSSALIFIFLSGISSGFSRNTVKRGIKVFSFGMLITLVTYFIFKDEYIRFGILHFLGLCMVLFPLLKKLNNAVLLILAIIIAVAAIPLQNVLVDTFLLLPLGFMYDGFRSVDYYPLIPYLSVFITGVITYKVYYYKKQSLFRFSFENKVIRKLSQKSLLIYLVHQPVIVSVIYAVMYFSGSIPGH